MQILLVPYDSGHRGLRMGRGPERLLGGGIETALRSRGHDIRIEYIEARGFSAEIGTSFALNRELAARTRSAVAAGRFPLVLAGNCSSAIGTLAGVTSSPPGVIWFDAHGDLNTPETTSSGFLDGMALATVTGRCWKHLAASVPGFSPVPDATVLHIGGRDLDPPEVDALARSEITAIGVQRVGIVDFRSMLEPALAALRARTERIYLHIDLDVLDPGEAQANEFAAPGGLTLDQVDDAIRLIGERFALCAAALTAYDPSYDGEGRVAPAAARLAETAAMIA